MNIFTRKNIKDELLSLLGKIENLYMNNTKKDTLEFCDLLGKLKALIRKNLSD